MLRKLLVASTAVVAISAVSFLSHPAVAGSCTLLSEKSIGVKEAETSNRSLKQLNRKANHWAKKSGYKKVWVKKSATSCTKKGVLYQCKAAAKVCGN
jgi:hypothetical protein